VSGGGGPPPAGRGGAARPAGKLRYAAGWKQSAGHADRRSPKEERKDGSNFGAVVGDSRRPM